MTRKTYKNVNELLDNIGDVENIDMKYWKEEWRENHICGEKMKKIEVPENVELANSILTINKLTKSKKIRKICNRLLEIIPYTEVEVLK
jgi:hypothetical protein